MKITHLEVEGATEEQQEKYLKIFSILIEKGALDGIRAGSVNIHFAQDCKFVGVQFSYFPWREKSLTS